MKRYHRIISVFFGLLISCFAYAQDGKVLFDMNCAACHAIGAKLVGPDLAGIGDRTTEDWMVKFIKNSKKLIDSGDEYAVKIFKENNRMPMQAFEGALSDDEINAIVKYLVTAKKPEPKVNDVAVEEVGKTDVAETEVKVVYSKISKVAIYVTSGFILMFFVIVVVILFSVKDLRKILAPKN